MEKLITDITAVLTSDQQVLYKQLQEESSAERKTYAQKLSDCHLWTLTLPWLDGGKSYYLLRQKEVMKQIIFNDLGSRMPKPTATSSLQKIPSTVIACLPKKNGCLPPDTCPRMFPWIPVMRNVDWQLWMHTRKARVPVAALTFGEIVGNGVPRPMLTDCILSKVAVGIPTVTIAAVRNPM